MDFLFIFLVIYCCFCFCICISIDSHIEMGVIEVNISEEIEFKENDLIRKSNDFE